MSALVEARFAGGEIHVEHAGTALDDDARLVTIGAPDWDVALCAHEARALAAALTNAATRAEKLTARLRRRSNVDEHLRDIDG